jgi:hypothetical protein
MNGLREAFQDLLPRAGRLELSAQAIERAGAADPSFDFQCAGRPG